MCVGLPCTIARIIQPSADPEIGPAFVEAGHELCSHGYRWVAHQGMPEEVERVRPSRSPLRARPHIGPIGPDP
jgi:hypothetical protein